ncbi:NAD-dependent succinate-semialdehyde dehydrogenase [Paeniglutamicibacter psychrophenolicus]|uniref:Succinate-semialdehyde dehydrogenase/glutarate-semialdehyde dehydrogenase n=1 Tax=Paeniglutamicibacter psychrophenolicus TaxID=257454 RepID=A0ABS4WBG4_9MICC|nr:NAD-dependent succinate-semialdehyde dehydrogenase [Paeniglutamicibacter psychrophenolicus]MBP2373550.1 succinate-semialdehyde dehydrogenase/glutarate-semialdehyde dehydrogenase [Paeniglutamicibacter psychrophenolicus]
MALTANAQTTPTATGYRVLNPATGAVVEEFATATDAEVQEAIAAAESGYQVWKDVDINERAKIVSRVGELFAERADELAAIITQEMGKALSESKGEAEFCKDIFEYFATEGPTLAADTEIKTIGGGKAIIQRLPVGPLLGIMPWNYPYYQVARFVAPNLMLGNTIVLKHAETCPRSALAIAQIMDDAGVPAGVYNNVFASHEQISTIIADDRIQGVSLTGSERAGAIIGEQAGRNLKKAVLELGGSDPYVILDSADIAGDAATAWATRMENTGQACNSNKRMIVMEDIFDDFVGELTKLAVDLVPGDPAKEEEGTFGPLSTRGAAEGVAAQVQDAIDKGATLHAGGVLHEGPGAYLAPTILSGITKGMRAYYEELFGPVAIVYKVSSDEEALEMANDTQYGLGGAVFSTDPARAAKVAAGLQVGMANVNAPAAEGADMPFGGVKRSGFGRELGPLGMEEFVNKRLFYVAD